VIGIPTKHYLPALDGLRFLCVVAIVVYHFVARCELEEPLPSWVIFLSQRLHFTDIFFILSGFLLTHTYSDRVNNVTEIRRFYGKRLIRLYPAHVVMLVAFALFAGGLQWMQLMPQDAGERYGFSTFIRQLLLVHAWWPEQQAAWNYPSWAISAAFGCCLLFPWLAKLLKCRWRSFYALVFVFWILATAGCYVLREASPMTLTFNGGLLRSLESFILGMVLWHGWQSGKVRSLPRWACMLLLLVIMVVMVQVEWPPELLLPAYLLLIGGVAHAKNGWLVQLKPFGKYSYSLLLVHALVGTVVLGGSEQFLAATPLTYIGVYMPLALLLSLGGAVVLHHYVERPAIRWLPVLWNNRWWNKPQNAQIYYIAPPSKSEIASDPQHVVQTSRSSSLRTGSHAP
jgi:peptidoglycan/LPS O-acetylase OafA/YrhL